MGLCCAHHHHPKRVVMGCALNVLSECFLQDPMAYTEADRDPQTGELHCDRVLKAIITSTDIQKLQYDLQVRIPIIPESNDQ
eukprot:1977281-Pyramimonas_sp.AAC.1